MAELNQYSRRQRNTIEESATLGVGGIAEPTTLVGEIAQTAAQLDIGRPTWAIGVFLAAFTYSSQRSETIVRLSHKLYQAGEESVYSPVKDEVARLKKFLCVDLKLKDACAGLDRVAAEIRPGLSAKEIAAISEEYLQKVTVPYGLALPRELSKDENRFLPVVLLAVQLDRWREYAETAPNDRPAAKGNEEVELLLDFGQRVIWPFLLAYALALRFTKVTIDVFEWAKWGDIINGTYVTCPSGRITEMRKKGVPIVSIGQKRYAGARAFEMYAIENAETKTPPMRAEPAPAAKQTAMSL